MDINQVDIKENDILALDKQLLSILLKDKTTGKNIIWATDEYSSYCEEYEFDREVTINSITGIFGNIIKPRTEKSKEEQTARVRGKAEVFTPSWVCNVQNNLVDEAWFGRSDVFNRETESGWETIYDKIEFPNIPGKTWQDYVKANRLEISCGEAPYLTSRYDAVTGVAIPVKDRIGLLDRKLRVVSENIDSEQEWVLWAKKAVQSVYGYDWQGDNVLLARENILFTFAEHYADKFTVHAIKDYLIMIAKVVAWNIWQMDGVKFVVPNSCHPEENKQFSLFDMDEEVSGDCRGCITGNHALHNGRYCRIYDWSANRSVEFYSFINPSRGVMNNEKV